MAELLRTYVINLRREWIKAPRYKKTPKAIRGIVTFCTRHMKSDDIRIMPEVNMFIWEHGKKNPPTKVQVDCKKDDKGVCLVQLHGVPFPTVKEEKKEGMTSKLAERFGLKAKGEKKEETKESEKQEAKAEEKKQEAKPAEKKPEPAAPAPKPAPKPVAPAPKPAEKKPEPKPTPKPEPSAPLRLNQPQQRPMGH